jgi:hypothetical protein
MQSATGAQPVDKPDAAPTVLCVECDAFYMKPDSFADPRTKTAQRAMVAAGMGRCGKGKAYEFVSPLYPRACPKFAPADASRVVAGLDFLNKLAETRASTS